MAFQDSSLLCETLFGQDFRNDSGQRKIDSCDILPIARFVFCHVRPCCGQIGCFAPVNAAADFIVSVSIGGDFHVVSVTVFFDDKFDNSLVHCSKKSSCI